MLQGSEEAQNLHLSFLELSLLVRSPSEPSNVLQENQAHGEALWSAKLAELRLLKACTSRTGHGGREPPKGPTVLGPQMSRQSPAILFPPCLNSRTTESERRLHEMLVVFHL